MAVRRRTWLVVGMCAVCACAQAQGPAGSPSVPNAPSAPLPSALATAKTLFLGNAGDQENEDCLRAYSSFYNGLNALGKYKLALDPGTADLVLELHYEISLGQAVASHDSNNSVRQFRVVLLDPKTHVVLWSLTERTNYAIRQVNRDKNLDETVAKLVDDVGQLLASSPPKNKSKVVHDPF